MIDFDSIAISIHALRGEGDLDELTQMRAIVISIHALRGEGDDYENGLASFIGHFNPRPPWGGRRQSDVIDEINASFQSTPSVGRATGGGTDRRQVSPHFNPRPPWGGRPKVKQGKNQRKHFNPRPPWGGRLCSPRPLKKFRVISIHALRGEGDERT